MSVIKRVVTLLRGSVREIGESVVDANATRIYEQEIVDARQAIVAARNDLTMVMAKEMQSAREIERLQQEAARYESLAVEALDKSQESLAEEVAGRVAALEEELAGQTKAHAAYALQVVKLKDLVRTAEQRIREHEREIGIAKTTESVYRATRSISENLGSGGSRLLNARESLERIKQRHEELADRMTAADQLEGELGHGALDRKLREAGIGEQADRQRDAMARIRARAATRTAPAAE
ncbi:PspA/IM30 family protein [Piscinibacter gummiphilus]|uniref:Phage shock protein A n=1 Tax=Piscinibacter gummiphilus TaxID=946333 RepID=A0A1W6LCY0_9BURK|nr:PspA/IM30 family protein [Piscinibacter gummiphilus]ARN22125.1 phage shock protein A [Piscinibacter gummiphilus]ATU66814.1 phage shock protein A [Piscinibacter gummiphilus]GLS94211.1 phage shock protein A [Piscinibacter gummiphilus]